VSGLTQEEQGIFFRDGMRIKDLQNNVTYNFKAREEITLFPTVYTHERTVNYSSVTDATLNIIFTLT
jgi:hypothetical protein